MSWSYSDHLHNIVFPTSFLAIESRRVRQLFHGNNWGVCKLAKTFMDMEKNENFDLKKKDLFCYYLHIFMPNL